MLFPLFVLPFLLLRGGWPLFLRVGVGVAVWVGVGPSFSCAGVGLLSRGEGWLSGLGLALRVGVGQAPTQKERMGNARPSRKGRKAGPDPKWGGGPGRAQKGREGQARPKNKGGVCVRVHVCGCRCLCGCVVVGVIVITTIIATSRIGTPSWNDHLFAPQAVPTACPSSLLRARCPHARF